MLFIWALFCVLVSMNSFPTFSERGVSGIQILNLKRKEYLINIPLFMINYMDKLIELDLG